MRHAGVYRALVVGNDDPEGRCRLSVRVPAVAGNAVIGPVWPALTDPESTAPPVPGKQVFVMFEGGDLDFPLWFGMGGGVSGLSAYEIAVLNGFVGSEADWLASLIGPPGGIVSTEISTDGISLTPSTSASFVYTTVALFKRGLITRFYLSSTSLNWGVRITSEPAGGGEVMFEALGITGATYRESWPVWFKNTETPAQSKMYVGVASFSGGSPSFTIDTLRGEALIP